MVKTKETMMSIRMDRELLKELDYYSDKKKSTRAEFIRQAIESFVAGLEESEDEQYIEDFVNAHIDEKEYLKYFKFPKVPEDILQIRKENLSQYKRKVRA